MDVIQVIRRDHRAIEQLFARFERAARDGELGEQRLAARQLVRELSVHAAVEEQFLYPALRAAGGTDEAEVLEALEEHHLVKLTLAELDAMSARDPRFAAKVRVLAANVREHVRDEEQHLLPRVRRALDAGQLRDLGERIASAKRAAPTRPHPAAPDTPPANFVTDALAAIYDRSRDAIRDGGEVLRSIAASSAAGGRDAARGIARDAERRGREVVEDVRERGREGASEARRRGREVVALATEAGNGARRVQDATVEAARRVQSRRGRPTRRPKAKRGAAPRGRAGAGRRSAREQHGTVH